MARASRSFERLESFSSSSAGGWNPVFGLIAPEASPGPPISLPRIVYSKSCTSSRSAEWCNGCVWARPQKGGVFRGPSGFCHTRPSCDPSGWHDEHEIHRARVIGAFEVTNSSLPRTHSGVCGGSHTLTLATLAGRAFVASYTLTAKSSVV